MAAADGGCGGAPHPPLVLVDWRLLRVAPDPEPPLEESALEVDMAELRYVGGSWGGGTARPGWPGWPMRWPTGPVVPW